MRPNRAAWSLVVSAFAVCGCTALLGTFEVSGEGGPGAGEGGLDGGGDVLGQGDVTSPLDAADAADALPPPPSGTVLLAKSFGGTKEDQVSATAVDPKGDIILAGAFYSPELDFGCAVRAKSAPSPTGGPNRDSYVVKLDPTGACKWVVPLTGTGDDQISGVAVGSNGDVFIAGSTSSSPALLGATAIPAGTGTANVYQGYFARLDAATGNVAYVRRFGGPGGAFGADVSISGSGQVVVGASWMKSTASEGIFFPGAVGGLNIPAPTNAQQYGVVTVYSPAGDPQWGRIFKAAENGSSVSVFKVVADQKDDILVAGVFNSASGMDPIGFPGTASPVTPRNAIGGSAVFYMKVAGTGTKGATVFTKVWASDNDIEPQAVAVDPMGNNAIIFSTYGRQDLGAGDQSYAGGSDIAFGGYGSGGNYGFGNLYGTPDSDSPGGIALGPAGNRFVTGGFGGVLDLGGGNLPHAGASDIFVASSDKTNKYRWAVSYGSSGGDSGRAMALGRSGLVVGAAFGGKINVGAQVFDTKGTDDILLLLFQP
jgi:hypothetical protein